MGGGGGGVESTPEPAKRNVSGNAANAEQNSLIRRKGLQSTIRATNPLGGGSNFGGM